MSPLYRHPARFAALVVLSLLAFARTGWAYSAPDSFDNPEPISTTSQNVRPAATFTDTPNSSIPATTESGEPVSYTDGGGNTVTLTSTSWYRLSPQQATGELRLEFVPNGSSTGSPVLRLFRLDGPGSFADLTLIAADTVRSEPTAAVTFTPTSGLNYYLQFGDDTGTSSGRLSLGRADESLLALDNDAFEAPTFLSNADPADPYTTAEASAQTDEEFISNSNNGPFPLAATRWFRFTGPGTPVTITATEAPGSTNLRMNVYVSNSSNPTSFFDVKFLGSGDNSNSSGEEVMLSETDAGTTYMVQLGVDGENLFGEIILNRQADPLTGLGSDSQARLAGLGDSPMAPTAAPPVVSGTVSVSGLDAPLPVELSAFSGQTRNGAVSLSWTTASERDNAGFTILRDGVEIASFRGTSALVGGGTTGSARNYGYTDRRVAPGQRYVYTLRSTDRTGEVHGYDRSVTVELTVAATPEAFKLHPASPNPFNPTTALRLDLPEAAQVTAEVYNALGQRVAVLFTGALSAGQHPLFWSAAGQTSGLYVVRVTAQTAGGRSVDVQRLTLTR